MKAVEKTVAVPTFFFWRGGGRGGNERRIPNKNIMGDEKILLGQRPRPPLVFEKTLYADALAFCP